MAFYIAIGLIGLCIASFFVEIKAQITMGLSIATLLFTIAQMLDSQINFWSEDLQNQVDVYNNVGNFNLSPENLMLTKTMFKYMDPPKKQKIIRVLASIVYGGAFIVLFLAFVIPLNISEKVGTSIAILSTSLLFFSIWIVDKQQHRKEQWNEVLMVSLMNKNTLDQTKIDVDAEVQPNEKDANGVS